MASLVVVLVLRPILRLIGFHRMFSHPSIAALSLSVVILGLLTAFV